ncbi:hypothetical protein DFH09DRAFT_1323387 [Mycena vulgaris]|nr:hypothetical protein DFH09DRAFT_1323387 [Mycena vulgaris]
MTMQGASRTRSRAEAHVATKRDFGDAQDGDEGATAGNQADFAAAFDVDTDMEREIFGSDSDSDESDP